jgi:DNA-binding transcriptional regulator YiaG
MSKIIKRLSNETGKVEEYRFISIKETVKIKGDTFKVLHEYYERLSDGELFEPFDDPDKNLNKDYDFYRKKYTLLSPKEVKRIRLKYGLNIRDFSEILGISYSNLSSIENGSLQTTYIDNLLRLVDDPYAFLKLVNEKKNAIPTRITDKLIPTLNELVVFSYDKHEKIARELKKINLDIRNNLIRLTNSIEFELEKGDQEWKQSSSTKSKTVSKKFSSMLFR